MFEKVLKKIELGIEKKEGKEYYLIYYKPLHAQVVEKYNWKLKKKLFDKLRQYDTYIYVRKK